MKSLSTTMVVTIQFLEKTIMQFMSHSPIRCPSATGKFQGGKGEFLMSFLEDNL